MRGRAHLTRIIYLLFNNQTVHPKGVQFGY